MQRNVLMTVEDECCESRALTRTRCPTPYGNHVGHAQRFRRVLVVVKALSRAARRGVVAASVRPCRAVRPSLAVVAASWSGAVTSTNLLSILITTVPSPRRGSRQCDVRRDLGATSVIRQNPFRWSGLAAFRGAAQA